MSNQAPIFSVVMPAYNAERYVGEAIESVLAQTLPDWELLVVNDCSTDRTLEVCNSYRDPRIRVFTTPQNLNAAGTRNLALEHARGEFIAFLDSDDVAMPNRLRMQGEELRKNSKLGFLGSQVSILNCGIDLEKNHWIYPQSNEQIKATMLFRCPFVISTVATRRELISKLGKPAFNRDLAPSEDYDFGSKLMPWCDFKNASEPVSKYRLHPGQLTDAKSDLIGQQMLKIQGTLLERLGIPATTENLLLHQKCGCGNPESLQDIINARVWLEKIRSSNLSQNIFPQGGLDACLGITWFHFCKRVPQKNMGLFLKYQKSDLARFYKSRREKLKFLIECMIMKTPAQ
jgi:glycosyltransferase involved in cell wall biosynthesis